MMVVPRHRVAGFPDLLPVHSVNVLLFVRDIEYDSSWPAPACCAGLHSALAPVLLQLPLLLCPLASLPSPRSPCLVPPPGPFLRLPARTAGPRLPPARSSSSACFSPPRSSPRGSKACRGAASSHRCCGSGALGGMRSRALRLPATNRCFYSRLLPTVRRQAAFTREFFAE